MKKYLELIKNYSIKFLLINFVLQIKRSFWQEIILGSYAQNYEDLEIEKILKLSCGRYLEIGGYHPTRLSNTYRFYKKGWTGVIVEPNPDIKNLFKKIRPNDEFLNIGISENGGSLKYFKYLIPALNSFVDINNGHKIMETINVNTKKISEVVTKSFDFVSIDTEGLDEMILKNWPWEKFKPKVICVETDKVKVNKILVKQNYKLFFKNNFNSIYCLKISKP